MHCGQSAWCGFGLLPPWAAFCFGRGLQRIVGPFVFGVAGAEVFADFEVGGFPEGAKVGGDLHGLVAGGEEVEEDGDCWDIRESLGTGRGARQLSTVGTDMRAGKTVICI